MNKEEVVRNDSYVNMEDGTYSALGLDPERVGKLDNNYGTFTEESEDERLKRLKQLQNENT